MTGPTKLALCTGIALVLFGITARGGDSRDIIVLGLCFVVGALAYWSGYDNGRHKERSEWQEYLRKEKEKNSN